MGAQAYSMVYAKSSDFTDTAAHVVDASASPLWERHIGEHVVYSLGIDRVGISDTSPT